METSFFFVFSFIQFLVNVIECILFNTKLDTIFFVKPTYRYCLSHFFFSDALYSRRFMRWNGELSNQIPICCAESKIKKQPWLGGWAVFITGALWCVVWQRFSKFNVTLYYFIHEGKRRLEDYFGLLPRASAAEPVDSGSIPGLVNPKTTTIGIYSLPDCRSVIKRTVWSLLRMW